MKSHGSGVSGRSDRDTSNRNTIFRFVNKLRLVKDEGAFDSVAHEFMMFLENENLTEMKEYFIKKLDDSQRSLVSVWKETRCLLEIKHQQSD